MAPPSRFELLACRLGGDRSIQLSYGGKWENRGLRERIVVRLGGGRSILLSYGNTLCAGDP